MIYVVGFVSMVASASVIGSGDSKFDLHKYISKLRIAFFVKNLLSKSSAMGRIRHRSTYQVDDPFFMRTRK